MNKDDSAKQNKDENKEKKDINPSASSGQENLREELIEEAEKDPSTSVRQAQDLGSGQENFEEADEEIEGLEKEEDSKENDQSKQLENQLKRVLADYQNLEKRIEENRRDWVLSANRSLIMKILPVVDDLFLTQKHIQDAGLDISIQKFLSILKEDGVDVIDTKDQEFDPNTMECISVQEGEKDRVLEEVRKGYIMYDRVLRPAQVIVGGSAGKNN